MIRWLNLQTGAVSEQRCSWCGAEAKGQVCPGDGSAHHHGAMHYPDGAEKPPMLQKGEGYWAACTECYPKAVEAWTMFRAAGRRQAQDNDQSKGGDK